MNEKRVELLMAMFIAKLGITIGELEYFVNSNLGDADRWREELYQESTPYSTFLKKLEEELGFNRLYRTFEKIFETDSFEEKIEEEAKRLYPENSLDLNYAYQRQQCLYTDEKLDHKKVFKYFLNTYVFYFNDSYNLNRENKEELSKILYDNEVEIEKIADILNVSSRTIRNYINK